MTPATPPLLDPELLPLLVEGRAGDDVLAPGEAPAATGESYGLNVCRKDQDGKD